MFTTLEEHNANPPSTWTVEITAPRIWHLNTAAGRTLESFPTKKAAEAARFTGHLVRAYDDETRWMGGETPPGHRSVAQLEAIATAAAALLHRIENVTTEQFSLGREKPEREALAAALGLL